MHRAIASPLFAIARLLAVAATLSVLTGCWTTTDVTANDPRVFQQSIRAAISLGDQPQRPADQQSGRAIEFEMVRAKGGGEQALTATQPPIIVNGTTFSGPVQLSNDFNLTYADISFRWRKFFGERSLGLELSGGVGDTSFGLAVTSPTQSASQHFVSWGRQGGVALIWRMRPETSVHARISGFMSGDDTGVHDFGRYELFLSQSLGENVALRAGYAKWEVNGYGSAGQSNFHATFAGPELDLGLNF